MLYEQQMSRRWASMNRAEGYNHLELQLRSSLTHSKNTVFWGTHSAQFAGIQEVSQYTLGFGEWAGVHPSQQKGILGMEHSRSKGRVIQGQRGIQEAESSTQLDGSSAECSYLI